LFEDERLRILGDAFQQFDISPVASPFQRLSFCSSASSKAVSSAPSRPR